MTTTRDDPLGGEALRPPPNAALADAVEVLRVWATPGDVQQLVLRTTWADPGTWGLLLADVARHAARAYAQEGHGEADALARIRQLLDAELTHPTSPPQQIT